MTGYGPRGKHAAPGRQLRRPEGLAHPVEPASVRMPARQHDVLSAPAPPATAKPVAARTPSAPPRSAPAPALAPRAESTGRRWCASPPGTRQAPARQAAAAPASPPRPPASLSARASPSCEGLPAQPNAQHPISPDRSSRSPIRPHTRPVNGTPDAAQIAACLVKAARTSASVAGIGFYSRRGRWILPRYDEPRAAGRQLNVHVVSHAEADLARDRSGYADPIVLTSSPDFRHGSSFN